MTSIETAKSQTNPVISDHKLRQLYSLMVAVRTETEKSKKASKRKMVLAFNEACEVATLVGLRGGDVVATLPAQSVSALNSSASSNHGGSSMWSVFKDGGRDRLAIASGIALKSSMQRGQSVVLAFTTGTEITRASDSVQLAQQRSLPIIYIEKITANVRKSRPTSHELPAIPVDDADAVAIYRVAYEAIDKARRGAGPTLIQCVEHRGLTRNGRLKDQRADPVIYMEHYLRKRNLWSDDLRV